MNSQFRWGLVLVTLCFLHSAFAAQGECPKVSPDFIPKTGTSKDPKVAFASLISNVQYTHAGIDIVGLWAEPPDYCWNAWIDKCRFMARVDQNMAVLREDFDIYLALICADPKSARSTTTSFQAYLEKKAEADKKFSDERKEAIKFADRTLVCRQKDSGDSAEKCPKLDPKDEPEEIQKAVRKRGRVLNRKSAPEAPGLSK